MKSKTGWVDFKKIKEKVSMEDILGHYGLLKGLKRKENELVGFCPIHDGRRQKKGCFCANTAKNMWHCFSCGAGGNVLDFVSLMESVDIRQAGLLIQKWFGIVSGEDRKLAKEKEEVERPKRKKKKAEPEEAANPPLTFELKTLDSKHAYLKERGLKKETIKEFGLGYCKRGLMERRVVIPIHSEKGELIAYAGRYPGDPPEGELKYKLPPKFKKSLVVFNLNRVKDTGEDKGLILVKDFFDVFNLWQSGYKNVVALMGTSMSNEQERLIVQAVGGKGKVALMFDSDEDGRSGSQDALTRLVSQVYVKLVKLGEKGSQPDTLSKEKLKKLLG
ncbi:DNA primase [subsurface metagenome]